MIITYQQRRFNSLFTKVKINFLSFYNIIHSDAITKSEKVVSACICLEHYLELVFKTNIAEFAKIRAARSNQIPEVLRLRLRISSHGEFVSTSPLFLSHSTLDSKTAF